MACGAVLPRHVSRGSSRNYAHVLSFVLSCGTDRTPTRYPDCLVEGTSSIPTATRETLSNHPAVTFVSLTVLLLLLMLGAALVGAYPITFGEFMTALGQRLAGGTTQDKINTVLFDIRLPRVFAAVVVGAAVSAAGAAHHNLLPQPPLSTATLAASTGA